MTDAVQKKKFSFKAGIISSLVGGLILAIPMGMMGMFPGLASMMGSHSAAVGFIIHLMISLIFGIAFALFAGMVKLHPAVSGLIFGVIIWIIGPMIIMPMMMGSGGGASNPCGGGGASMSMWLSLATHLMYGVVIGITYRLVKGKAA